MLPHSSLQSLPNFVSQFTGPGVVSGCPLLVGLEGRQGEGSVGVYPNQMLETAQLGFEPIPGRSYQFQVLDIMGRVALLESVNDHPHRIERGDLPKGTYIYQLLEDSRVVASGRLLLR